MKRRTLLTRAAIAAAGAKWTGVASTGAALVACGRASQGPPHAPGPKRDIELAWVGGAAHARGHRLRDAAWRDALVGSAWPAPAERAAVLVLGGGVAGLAAARAFNRHGIDDVHVLELEDSAGGNARGHARRHRVPARRALPPAAGPAGARGGRVAARDRPPANRRCRPRARR
ncbi:MAG: NAD(P)-binding protein [Rubrivivax sp.]